MLWIIIATCFAQIARSSNQRDTLYDPAKVLEPVPHCIAIAREKARSALFDTPILSIESTDARSVLFAVERFVASALVDIMLSVLPAHRHVEKDAWLRQFRIAEMLLAQCPEGIEAGWNQLRQQMDKNGDVVSGTIITGFPTDIGDKMIADASCKVMSYFEGVLQELALQTQPQNRAAE